MSWLGDRRHQHAWRYGASMLVHALLATGVLVDLGASRVPAWVVALACLAALALVQFGIHAHDASHRQILRGRRASRLLVLALCNAACGISAAWWRDKHLRHHRHPNQVGLDPDAYAIFSFFPDEAMRRRGVLRVIARQQAAAFILILSFTAAYFQILSLMFLVRERPRGWLAELGILVVRHGVIAVVVFSSLPPGLALLFLAVHYAVAGWYLGAIFATNHYGLPMSRAGSDAPGLFEVTRNVRTGPLGDYLFGGLNYQSEHHVAPGASRYDLPALAVQVRERCRRDGLPYHECGWGQALAEVLRGMRAVGAHMRT